jgi:hypothetical protein
LLSPNPVLILGIVSLSFSLSRSLSLSLFPSLFLVSIKVGTGGLPLSRQVLESCMSQPCFALVIFLRLGLAWDWCEPWSSLLCFLHSWDYRHEPPYPAYLLKWALFNFCLFSLELLFPQSLPPNSWNYRHELLGGMQFLII